MKDNHHLGSADEPSSLLFIPQLSLRVSDHVNAMLAYWDKDQVCRFANRAYQEWFGKSREEMVDKITMQQLMGDDLYNKNLPYISGALQGVEQHFEREIKVPTGQLRHSQASYYPDIIDGQVEGFFVQVVDISNEKNAEQNLLQLNQELSAILNSATQVSIIGTDTTGIITHFSKGAETLLGYTAAEMIGKQTPAIIHLPNEVQIRADDLNHEYAREINGFDVFVEYARQGRYESREWTYVRKDGTTFPVQLVVTAIKDQEEKITGFLGVATDLTERKQIEDSIRKYAELVAKNKEMEQFSYVASHDLQEPLQTVTNFAELLHKQYADKLDTKAHVYLEYMLESAQRMRQLIKGLLDYSRLGHERAIKTVDCNEVLKNVTDDLNAIISQTGAIIEVGPMPVLKGFPLEIKLLFQNLISNAIKFKRTGVVPVVKISAECRNDIWQFKVEDNGIGIEKENFTKIFKIFKRLNSRDVAGGNGIGLAHCEKIVELHHGDIWVNSVPGQGSTFYFTLDT